MSDLYSLLMTPIPSTSFESHFLSHESSSSSFPASDLTLPVKRRSKRHIRKTSTSDKSGCCSEDGAQQGERQQFHSASLEWSTIHPASSKGLQEIPAEVIHNTCREKRSRGYIARILAAKNSRAVIQRNDSTISDNGGSSKKRSGDEELVQEISLFPLSSEPEAKFGINMRKWRVKAVVEDHVKMMRALSPATLSIHRKILAMKRYESVQRCRWCETEFHAREARTKMPGDLKHMDLKPRLLGSDRTTIIKYQEEMRRLLESEYGILRHIKEFLRSSASSKAMSLQSVQLMDSNGMEISEDV